jgi:hypothetical protein
VAIFTLIFGAFGAISASRRASKARLLGVSGQRYWWTFAGVLIMSSLLQLIMVGIALPVYLAAVHDAQAKAGGTTSETTSLSTAATPTRDARALEADIVAHGRSEASGTATGATGGVTAAACSAVNVVPDGSGTYRCLVSFSDSAEQTYTIKLAPDGTWTTGEGP